MPPRRILTNTILLTAALVVSLVVYEVLRGPRSMFFGFDRCMQRHYEDIAIGSAKKTSIEILGSSWSKSDTFNLPQRHGFEQYFEAAERSTAVEYLLWVNGGNWYYCIGFDASGTAVVKGEGNS